MRLLVQEKLGFLTVLGGGPATVDGFFAIAGCESPTDLSDRGCNGKHSYYHVHLEGWTAGYPHIWNQIQQEYPDTAPQNLGGMGYSGLSGMYIPREVIESAYDQEGMVLQFYRAHNTSKSNPSKYFDDINALNAETLKTCGETRLMDSQAMSVYARVTNDWDGVDNSSGTLVGKCFLGYFWFAPSCRANPLECYTYITAGPGYGYEHTMQKATWYNMPMAVAVAKLWSDYTTLPMQVKSSFYWWQPDPTFLSWGRLDASRILFPPQDRSAQRRGIYLTSDEDVPIEKYASIDLQALAPTVYKLLKALNIDMIVVNKLMSDRMDTGDSAEDVACRWLKANQDIWESWMPDETKCFPQFGLYNEHTQQFVEDRTDPAGLTCRACDSGFYSNRIKDGRGITHVCMPCAPGTTQPSGASLQCDPCPTGEYQDEFGSTSCKRCGQGKYQDTKGQSQCKVCPVSTTTLGLGSASVLECGCEAGSINIANEGQEAVCTRCIEGLSCPFSSSLDALKTGEAPLGEHYQPALKEGFYSFMDSPLEVFQCIEKTFCPGGIPQVCNGGRLGTICAECPPGETWASDQCMACDGLTTFLWWSATALLLVACTGSYYVLEPKFQAIATARQALDMSLGLSFTWLQTVAIIGLMTVEWPSSVSGPISFGKFLVLDLDTFSFSCFGGERALLRYILKVLIFPMAIAWMIAIYFLSKCLPRAWQWKTAQSVNTIGVIMQASFATMSTIALESMMCYVHPNGSYSLVKFSSVTCGGSEQMGMIVAGVFLLFVFVIGFLVVVTCATIALPSWSARQMKSRIQCFNFLIKRFRLDKWWFGIPLILRGPLMSLVVTCATDYPAVQVCMNSLILSIYTAIQATARPWKVPLLNWMDLFTSILLVQITLMSGLGIRSETQGFSNIYSASLLLLLVCAIVVMCSAVAVALVFEFFGQEAKDSSILRVLESCSDGLGAKLLVIAHGLSDKELKLQQALDTMNSHDLSHLETCLDLIGSELLSDTGMKRGGMRLHSSSLSRIEISQVATKLPAEIVTAGPSDRHDPVDSNQDIAPGTLKLEDILTGVDNSEPIDLKVLIRADL
ncbi:unnamed protein product [Cladocopium goreaui]|uniref:Tyrosine-protein kinase ephrin type A/B receptor-like domain-containing protein n=1 Tax=Cladocopium goreaui TaxID=2562237 RepID=A0A9P1DG33_9DINO|nr:unnamed protein product [Cladocopium goreaui]